jgi:hypothetical protein
VRPEQESLAGRGRWKRRTKPPEAGQGSQKQSEAKVRTGKIHGLLSSGWEVWRKVRVLPLDLRPGSPKE